MQVFSHYPVQEILPLLFQLFTARFGLDEAVIANGKWPFSIFNITPVQVQSGGAYYVEVFICITPPMGSFING